MLSAPPEGWRSDSRVEAGAPGASISAAAGRWWVVHTKARHEKALAACLEQLEIAYFLPVKRVVRDSGRRRREVRIPLFPGYLFICGDDTARAAVFGTHHAAVILDVRDQERLKSDLRNIHQAIMGDRPVTLYPAIRHGCQCVVRAGALRGLKGVAAQRRGQWRVYVSVDALGQSAEVKIDRSLLDLTE